VIEIRPVTTLGECGHVSQIIMAAWNAGVAFAIPERTILAIASEKGGLVLLAWDGDTPVGFCLGFLSYAGSKKRLKHWSHMAAVIPGYQGSGVGQRLKWAQRAAVQQMGIDLMSWTYDPLETLNGRLNLHKLGAVCSSYRRNIYEEGRDGLNQGAPTDRFQVDWQLNSPWVRAHRDGAYFRPGALARWLARGVPVVNKPRRRQDLWQPGQVGEGFSGADNILVAVPRNYQGIKQASQELALDWRYATRALFERAFADSLVAIDLLVDDQLCYYLLERKGSVTPPPLTAGSPRTS
jgi:predicted GNAT superfamily acetyltransferase